MFVSFDPVLFGQVGLPPLGVQRGQTLAGLRYPYVVRAKLLDDGVAVTEPGAGNEPALRLAGEPEVETDQRSEVRRSKTMRAFLTAAVLLAVKSTVSDS